MILMAYAVLAMISHCYSPLIGRLLTRYSPVRHYPLFNINIKIKFVRLACLMCAASVYPEPGSNSLVIVFILLFLCRNYINLF